MNSVASALHSFFHSSLVQHGGAFGKGAVLPKLTSSGVALKTKASEEEVLEPKPDVWNTLITSVSLRHLGIIMDGNRRWAKQKGMPSTLGHIQGVHSFRRLVRALSYTALPYVTAYTFSTENWKRSPEEVTFLMKLITDSLYKELEELHQRGVRIKLIGSSQGLPAELITCMDTAIATTANNTGLTLQLAINYGGRLELVHAIQALARQVKAGTLSPEAITEADVNQALYQPEGGDVDLIVRPGGESRLSNFLLWQSAYSELVVSPVLWPDFTPKHLLEVLEEVRQRQRRFGR